MRGHAVKSLLKIPCLVPGLLLVLAGCATTETPEPGLSAQALAPRIGANLTVLEELSTRERGHLQLIATNFVATLVQIPKMQAGSATLQVSAPATAFGNAIVRALEEAGFGLQLVSADQGQNYVSYSKRFSETESGLVTDYSMAVGRISMSREFTVEQGHIYPSSLLSIDGTLPDANIELADSIFTEQGGRGDSFISGVQFVGQPEFDLVVDTIDVYDFDEVPLDKRSTQQSVFEKARMHFHETNSKRKAPDLTAYEKYRRTVLIFDNDKTQVMGNANKLAVRLLVREFSDNDIMLIKACQDADGTNQASMSRAVRVEQELSGFGVPAISTYIAPCSRISYRHSSDNSPTPVELIHYRPN